MRHAAVRAATRKRAAAALGAACLVACSLDLGALGPAGGDAGLGAGGAGEGGATGGAGGGASDCGMLCASPSQCTALGRFSTWCGKVNLHTDEMGGWVSDADCETGCNVASLAYCQKFWTSTIGVTPTTLTAQGKVWAEAGCVNAYPSPGQNEYICWGCIP